MWKNIETNYGSNGGIEDTTLVYSTIMIVGMLPFSKPLFDVDSMPSSPFSHTFCLQKVLKNFDLW
jgi:hypothetical protein